MSAVLSKVIATDPKVKKGTDSYVDDIVVNEAVVSCQKVMDVLKQYGLEAKPPENVVGEESSA